jgi:carbon storage regulator
MLVLRRKAGEAIVLNGTITIHVLAVEGERVKLGISAPPEVVIVRSELLDGQTPMNGPDVSSPGAPPREPDDPQAFFGDQPAPQAQFTLEAPARSYPGASGRFPRRRMPVSATSTVAGPNASRYR